MAKGSSSTGDKMLTATALAKELKIPPAELRRRIKEAGIEPDAVKCGCAYYSKETAERIKKAIVS